MTRSCPLTVVLLVCFCSAVGVRAAMSAYDEKLYLLSTIVKQDYLWKDLFLESVYFEMDRTYYGYIIDNELLKNAIYEPPKVDDVATANVEQRKTSGSTQPKDDSRNSIIPHMFIRNIIFQRFVVGSLLDLGLNLLKLSFKCLLYKHMVHLITLINVEMKRSDSQNKAASWAGKSKEVIESILMTMGALQFTDTHVLATLSFFDIYETNGKNMTDYVKNKYSEELSIRSNKMLDYVKDVCVVIPNENSEKTMEEQVADMIKVYKNKSLYNVGGSFAIDNSDYKKMIRSSWGRLGEVFGSTPRINGMSEFVWYDILRFQKISNQKKPN